MLVKHGLVGFQQKQYRRSHVAVKVKVIGAQGTPDSPTHITGHEVKEQKPKHGPHSLGHRLARPGRPPMRQDQEVRKRLH